MNKTIDIIKRETGEVLRSYNEEFTSMEFLSMTEAFDQGYDIGDYDDYTVFFRITFKDGSKASFPCQEYRVSFN